MTEEIPSDPESKPLGDEGRGALQLSVKNGEGGDGAGGSGGDGGEERWKRERWTRNESMALVSAMKQLEEDANTSSSGGDAKWKSISHICSTRGVQRTSVQCRKRWNTLLAAYRKIKEWEGRNGLESYWSVGGLDFKAKKLPAGFDEEIWNVMNSFLAGRGTGASPRLFPFKADESAGAGTSSAALPNALQAPALPAPASQALPPAVLALPQAPTQAVAQPVAQPPVGHSVVQPAAQPATEPASHPAAQPVHPPVSASPAVQTALPTQQVLQSFSQSQSDRGKREKDGPMSGQRKRKRHGRVEAPPISIPAPPNPPKVDEQAAGGRRCVLEGVDPLAQFLSSFLEKSLESYERNSELNRSLRREQGEKLVAVLGSLSSAVRDLVQSSVLQK